MPPPRLLFLALLEGLGEPVVAGGLLLRTRVAAGLVVSIVVVASTSAGTAFHVGLALHAEGDAIAHEIDFGDGDLHFLSDLDDFAGVSNKLIAELADVDESVLVNTNIDESTEGGDVGNDARKLHADFEISRFINSFGEGKHLELLARMSLRVGKPTSAVTYFSGLILARTSALVRRSCKVQPRSAAICSTSA